MVEKNTITSAPGSSFPVIQHIWGSHSSPFSRDSPCVPQNCIPDAKCHRFLQPIKIRHILQRVRTFRLSHCGTKHLRGGADKSLARPGSKQATATKLEIYSIYSPRSSIHFLDRCFNFCRPLKKIQKFVRPTRFPRQEWPPRRKKNGHFSIVFSVQGTDGGPTGPDPENRVGDQDPGSTGKPVLLGCKCPVSRGIVVQEQAPLGDLPAAFLTSKCPSIASAEISNTPR